MAYWQYSGAQQHRLCRCVQFVFSWQSSHNCFSIFICGFFFLSLVSFVLNRKCSEQNFLLLLKKILRPRTSVQCGEYIADELKYTNHRIQLRSSRKIEKKPKNSIVLSVSLNCLCGPNWSDCYIVLFLCNEIHH